MAGSSFRDRFYTPPVARAITSPAGILLAGVVTAVAVVLGLSLAPALALGLLAWVVKVLLAVPRPARGERIDPFGVQEPWRRFVQESIQARNRFDEVVSRTRPGPLRDNLTQVAERVEAAVQECWQIAKRGQVLARARRDIDVPDIDRQLGELTAADPNDPTSLRVAESLRAQRATADRLDQVIRSAHSELRMLDARLDESVVRAIELSAQSSTDESLAGLGTDVENLVTEMEALRQAMDETHRAARPGLGTGADEG